jgi:hypothetical protein
MLRVTSLCLSTCAHTNRRKSRWGAANACQGRPAMFFVFARCVATYAAMGKEGVMRNACAGRGVGGKGGGGGGTSRVFAPFCLSLDAFACCGSGRGRHLVCRSASTSISDRSFRFLIHSLRHASCLTRQNEIEQSEIHSSSPSPVALAFFAAA